MTIKALINSIGLTLFLLTPLHAAENAKPPTQQQRMKDCNAKASGMKGDERKQFMSRCLSGKETESAKITPQQRMKDCNAKAAGKKSEERKTFMSSCLKG